MQELHDMKRNYRTAESDSDGARQLVCPSAIAVFIEAIEALNDQEEGCQEGYNVNGDWIEIAAGGKVLCRSALHDVRRDHRDEREHERNHQRLTKVAHSGTPDGIERRFPKAYTRIQPRTSGSALSI